MNIFLSVRQARRINSSIFRVFLTVNEKNECNFAQFIVFKGFRPVQSVYPKMSFDMSKLLAKMCKLHSFQFELVILQLSYWKNKNLFERLVCCDSRFPQFDALRVNILLWSLY